MYTIEFEATIRNGVIEVPAEVRESLSDRVRVILLGEERKSKRNRVEYLMDHPVRLADSRPLTREETHER